MIRFKLILFTLFISGFTFAQTSAINVEIVLPEQFAEVFSDSVRKKLRIIYPVYRAYKYADKSGEYYCVLTESRDSTGEKNDTLSRFIRAVNCKVDVTGFVKTWEINDRIEYEPNEENNIWFWTKYSEFKDHDKDLLVDPVIVYGSAGRNNIGDGRIKFIIYYRGKKIAIRHQNGTLDFERETKIDKSFYTLPLPLQNSVKLKMKQMEKEDQAIFPHGWENAMKRKEVLINEM